MLTQLRAIFDIIVEFQAKQSHMYTECLQEIELRQQYNAAGVAHTEKVIICSPFILKPLRPTLMFPYQNSVPYWYET